MHMMFCSGGGECPPYSYLEFRMGGAPWVSRTHEGGRWRGGIEQVHNGIWMDSVRWILCANYARIRCLNTRNNTRMIVCRCRWVIWLKLIASRKTVWNRIARVFVIHCRHLLLCYGCYWIRVTEITWRIGGGNDENEEDSDIYILVYLYLVI